MKWMQGMSCAIWTGSSSCPWLAVDASLTAPSFQLAVSLASAAISWDGDLLSWVFSKWKLFLIYFNNQDTEKETGKEGISRR